MRHWWSLNSLDSTFSGPKTNLYLTFYKSRPVPLLSYTGCLATFILLNLTLTPSSLPSTSTPPNPFLNPPLLPVLPSRYPLPPFPYLPPFLCFLPSLHSFSSSLFLHPYPPSFTLLSPNFSPLPFIYLYILCLGVCIQLTAEPIGPKFCLGP